MKMTFSELVTEMVDLILDDIEIRDVLADAWRKLSSENKEQVRCDLITIGIRAQRRFRAVTFVDAVIEELIKTPLLLKAWNKIGHVFQTVARDRWIDIGTGAWVNE